MPATVRAVSVVFTVPGRRRPVEYFRGDVVTDPEHIERLRELGALEDGRSVEERLVEVAGHELGGVQPW